jgi:5'-3' exonuclease
LARKVSTGGIDRIELSKTNNFQLLYISILREYFDLEFKTLGKRMAIPYNLERVIDDFIFFCFFIGNDFLPSLNTLDISEGSLDVLFDFYKESLPSLEDYITNEGTVNWKIAEIFIKKLANYELEILQKRFNQMDKLVSFNESNQQKDTNELIYTFKVNEMKKEMIRSKKIKKVQELKRLKKDNTYKKKVVEKRKDLERIKKEERMKKIEELKLKT